MRLEDREQLTKTPVLSPSIDRFVAPSLRQIPDENKTVHINSENDSSPDDDYLALVTRATNDAIRDWNVKSGTLSWPQGLLLLFGYDNSSIKCDNIGFWQKNLYPGDRARIAASIHDALNGSSKHWSGEYRFRRADGNHINVLERAVILRDADGSAA